MSKSKKNETTEAQSTNPETAAEQAQNPDGETAEQAAAREETERLAAENKEFGTSDLTADDRTGSNLTELVEKDQEIAALKEMMKDFKQLAVFLTEKGFVIVVGESVSTSAIKAITELLEVKSANQKTIFSLNDEIVDLRKMLRAAEYKIEVLQYDAEHSRPDGRPLAAGTELIFAGEIVTLPVDTVVNFPGDDNEQKFAGMLIHSSDKNYELNAPSLRFNYNRSTGGILPAIDQPEGSIVSDAHRRLLGLPVETAEVTETEDDA